MPSPLESECSGMRLDTVRLSDMFMMCVCVCVCELVAVYSGCRGRAGRLKCEAGPFRPALRETLGAVKWVSALGAVRVCVRECVAR